MKSLDKLFLIFILAISLTAFGQDYQIYVSGANSDNILKYEADGSNPEILISANSGGLDWPQDIIFLGNKVIISSLNTGNIKEYDAVTGAYLGNFIQLTSGAGPTRMKIGPDGLLYVLQWGNFTTPFPVLRYNLDGTFVDEFTEAFVTQGIGLDWDTAGNLYVSSYGQSRIHQFSPTGEHLGIFINSNLSGPVNLWFDEAGDLFVINYNGGNVVRFNGEGVFQETFITGLSNPEGIAFTEAGELLIGNGGTNSVKKYSMEGDFIEDIIENDPNLAVPNAVILHNATVVSTTEPLPEKVAFVYPSIGVQFFIHENFSEEVKYLKVLDSTGQTIKEITLNGTNSWNGHELPKGTYFLLGENDERKQWLQQIVIEY